MFRFSLPGRSLLDRMIGSPASVFYEPPPHWDGSSYAIASSTLTHSEFMKVNEAGDPIGAPFGRTEIPFGGWTAALRVRCVADGNAACSARPDAVGAVALLGLLQRRRARR